MTFSAKHISVSINRTSSEVYEYVSNPINLPKWAAGLSGSIRKVDEDWIAESQMGTVKVRFVEKNKFGILDHEVMLPSCENIYNPMRVFPNNDGSELVFTLYQRLGMSDQMFANYLRKCKNRILRWNNYVRCQHTNRKVIQGTS